MSRLPINLTETPELHLQSAAMLDAVHRSGALIFSMGGQLVRIDEGEHGAMPKPLTLEALRHEVSTAARCFFVKTTQQGDRFEIDRHPPMDAVKDAMASPSWPFPVLDGVIRHPTIAENGSIVSRRGYDATTRLFLDVPPELEEMTVPVAPTAEEIAAAVQVIDEIVHDFPFDSPASRAGALALFITVLCRSLIPGSAPIFLVQAPSPGTGKSLLVNALLLAVTGEEPAALTETRDGDELQKQMVSILMTGPEAILIDNLNGKIDSGIISSIATTGRFQGRILGRSGMADLRVRSPFILTANNPTSTGEIARRCVPIRLAPDVEKPWTREGFRHPDLRGFIRDNRRELIAAGLTLGRAWIADERPKPKGPPFGSFEGWHNAIGGILESVGITGLLENSADFYENADTETTSWTAFTSAWWATQNTTLTPGAELLELALRYEVIDEGRTSRGTSTNLGRALAKMTGRVFGGLKIEKGGIISGTAFWRLKKI